MYTKRRGNTKNYKAIFILCVLSIFIFYFKSGPSTGGKNENVVINPKINLQVNEETSSNEIVNNNNELMTTATSTSGGAIGRINKQKEQEEKEYKAPTPVKIIQEEAPSKPTSTPFNITKYLEDESKQQAKRIPAPDFYRGLRAVFETIPFFSNGTKIDRNQFIENNEPYPYKISLITQTTIDRLNKVSLMAERWMAPISVAVLIKNTTELESLETFLKETPIIKQYCDVHILIGQDTRYPVNSLRNLAIDNAKTDIIAVMDADFVTPLNFHEYLTNYLEFFYISKQNYHLYERFIENPKFDINNSNQSSVSASTATDIITQKNYLDVAFIIPSFSSSLDPKLLPIDKESLLDSIKDNLVYPSNLKVCPKCHTATNYPFFYETNYPYEIKYNWIYEPYLIYNRSNALPFDDKLKGYGFDKNTHSFAMAAKGFHFLTLPHAFMIHINHPESSWQGPSQRDQQWDSLRVVCEYLPIVKKKFGLDLKKSFWGEPLKDNCFTSLHW